MAATPSEHADAFWWRANVGEPVHARLVPFGRHLQGLYRSAHQFDRVLERIYESPRLRTYQLALAALDRHGLNAARLNVAKAIVDTFVSRQSKERPMPAFDTVDSDWRLKRKAKEYRKFIVGKMLETEFDDLRREALHDGSIIGTGITRIDDKDDDVFAERILREELLFDPRECKKGNPRTSVLVHRVAKWHLAELFPSFKAQIMQAQASQKRPQDENDDDVTIEGLEDYTDVFEAHHLPTNDQTEDGRRVLCIDGATLVSERWHECRLPYAMFRHTKPRRGIWGRGIIQGIADLQHRVNCIVRDMQLNLAATGRGYYAVNEAADVPTEMLTGWAPFKMKYKGNQPPEFTVPTPVNRAQVEMLMLFIEQMYQLSGVSMAAASQQSQTGLSASGVAREVQYDIDSERFAMVQANYARYSLDAAQLYLDASKRVARARAKDKGKKRPWVAVWRNQDAIQKLDYDKVAIEDGEYRLRLEAVNFLPDTRAGKLSVVEQLTKAGVIPQWLVATLFDEPDIQQANAIQLAPFHNAMRKMDELADEDLPEPVPEPYNELELELKISTAYYNRVQYEKAPIEIQERYKRYVDLVEELIKKRKAGEAALAPPIAPPGMPPGMPPDAIPPMGAPPMGPPGPPAPPMLPGPMA